jgi:hypothetical protein
LLIFRRRAQRRSVAEWMQAMLWILVRAVGQNSARSFLTPEFLTALLHAAAADRGARSPKILLAGDS